VEQEYDKEDNEIQAENKGAGDIGVI